MCKVYNRLTTFVLVAIMTAGGALPLMADEIKKNRPHLSNSTDGNSSTEGSKNSRLNDATSLDPVRALDRCDEIANEAIAAAQEAANQAHITVLDAYIAACQALDQAMGDFMNKQPPPTPRGNNCCYSGVYFG